MEGRVLIYVQEHMLDNVAERYPARRYVMVDDKLRILAAIKGIVGDRLTAVFARQAHYAFHPAHLAIYPPADLAIERIGDLRTYDFSSLLGAGAPATGNRRRYERDKATA